MRSTVLYAKVYSYRDDREVLGTQPNRHSQPFRYYWQRGKRGKAASCLQQAVRVPSHKKKRRKKKTKSRLIQKIPPTPQTATLRTAPNPRRLETTQIPRNSYELQLARFCRLRVSTNSVTYSSRNQWKPRSLQQSGVLSWIIVQWSKPVRTHPGMKRLFFRQHIGKKRPHLWFFF